MKLFRKSKGEFTDVTVGECAFPGQVEMGGDLSWNEEAPGQCKMTRRLRPALPLLHARSWLQVRGLTAPGDGDKHHVADFPTLPVIGKHHVLDHANGNGRPADRFRRYG